MAAMQAVSAVNDSSNLVLDEVLFNIGDPDVFAVGMVFRGVDFLNPSLSSRYFECISKEMGSWDEASLIDSIVSKLKSNIDNVHISPEFLMDEYQKMGGSRFSFIETLMTTKLIVIDFWASWCLPCRTSIRKELKELSKAFSSEKLMVIGVNLDQDRQNALDAIK